MNRGGEYCSRGGASNLSSLRLHCVVVLVVIVVMMVLEEVQ